MNDIFIDHTEFSPEVNFAFSSNKLSIKGEAFPENANVFFRPILIELENYLTACKGQTIEFDFHLTYFNSASTKMLYTMFNLLNRSASSSNIVLLNWYHDIEDDTILEFGEGVHEDYPALEFTAIPVN